MKTVRYSKQREAILKELQSRCDHPTADQVYSTLKQTHPELSLGTVYRNLGFLADNGQIRKLDIGDGTVRYDGTVKPHIHFICKECNNIIDISLDQSIADVIKNNIEEQIDDININLEGICTHCLKKAH